LAVDDLKETAMSHVTSKDGTRIGYDRQGEGAPVVLVGGAFQYRAFDPRTQELAKLLAESFTVYNYDRRGRGESGDTQPYAVRREIEDLEAVIAAAGDGAYVFAMSSGAVLALRAVAAGLPVSKLAIYEPPFIVDDSRPRVPDGLAEKLSELASAGRPGDAVELFVTAAVALPEEVVAQLRQAPIWSGFEAVAHTLVYDTSIMGDYLVPAAWVAVPMLVGEGGASLPWMRNAAAAVADALPNARLHTIEGQQHDVAPDLLAPVLTDFFQR
jgi:pimeloyl-ACP methyl ester carboxylesterase